MNRREMILGLLVALTLRPLGVLCTGCGGVFSRNPREWGMIAESGHFPEEDLCLQCFARGLSPDNFSEVIYGILMLRD